MTLAELGWTDELEAAFTTYSADGFEPARVVAEHRGGFAVRTERDDRLAHVRGKLREDELFGGMPTVGDWVVVVDAGERYAIEAVLPRRTKVSRKTPVAQVGRARARRERRHDLHRHRARRRLQRAPARALPRDRVGQRRRPRHRSDQARRERRPGNPDRGGSGRDGRPRPRGQQRHGRGPRAARRVSGRGTDDRADRIVGRRQVDARELARRARADADRRPAKRRPRPSHHEAPPAACAEERRTC